MSERSRATIGIFLLSMAGLAFQVALTRVLSVMLWYHFAFLVVSLAVFGFGLSGMYLLLRPAALEASRASTEPAARATLGLAAGIVGCFVALNALPFDPFGLLSDPVQLIYALVSVLCLTFPFFLAGMAAGLLLLSQRDVGRLYGADLVGAGLGAVVVVVLLDTVGGVGAVFAAALLAAAGAAFLAVDRRTQLASVLAVTAFAALTAFADDVVRMRVTANKIVLGVQVAEVLHDPQRNHETRWNSLSRVDVVDLPHERVMLIDAGVAMLRMPRLPSGVPSQPWNDFGSIAFAMRPRARVFIAGSAGGWEVAGALSHGAERITAVEINPDVNELVAGSQSDFVGRVFADPRVDLVTDEVRAFLERSPDRWDVIIAAHTISNAATVSGAMSLAESYTLTEEAFDLYFERLLDGGILYLLRPLAQMPRLVAAASRALQRRGLDPRARIAVLVPVGAPKTGAFVAGMLVTLDESVAQVEDVARRHQTVVIHGPRRMDPAYVDALQGKTTSPIATDDRPFFNMARPWSELGFDDVARVLEQGDRGRMALEDEPVAEVSILVLFAIALFAAAILTAVPLRLARARLAGAGPRGATTAYFGALGVGFIFVELGMMQRFGLLSGSPTAAFVAVVGTLLVASGIGAHLSAHTSVARAGHIAVAAAAMIALLGLGSAPLADAMLGSAWPLRLGSMVLVLGPMGVAMGMLFPLGVRRLEEHDPQLLAYAWGINGFASVLGSVVCLIVATSLGFTAVLLAASGVYLGAALAHRSAHE